MAAITFEVENMPGIYLWGQGMPAPIPFTDIPTFQNMAAALKAVPCTAPLSQEMYLRLFVAPVNVTIPPIEFPGYPAMHVALDFDDKYHITGTIG